MHEWKLSAVGYSATDCLAIWVVRFVHIICQRGVKQEPKLADRNQNNPHYCYIKWCCRVTANATKTTAALARSVLRRHFCSTLRFASKRIAVYAPNTKSLMWLHIVLTYMYVYLYIGVWNLLIMPLLTICVLLTWSFAAKFAMFVAPVGLLAFPMSDCMYVQVCTQA